MNPQYFEAILQLRNTANCHFYEVASRIESSVEGKKREDIFITKVEKVRGGLDYYLSSKKFAKSLGETLSHLYGGEFQANPRLFSRNRQTSKDIYRLNVLVRLPEVEKGAVIRLANELLLVTGFGKNFVQCRNLKTGKHFTMPVNASFQVECKPTEHTAIITQKKPHIEVLHPETFQSIKVENVKETRKDKLKIAIIDGKAYNIGL